MVLMYGAELGPAVRGIGRLAENVVACGALVQSLGGAGTGPVAVHTGAPRGAAPARGNTAARGVCSVPRGPRVNVGRRWMQQEERNLDAYLRCLTGRAGGRSAASLSGPEAMATDRSRFWESASELLMGGEH